MKIRTKDNVRVVLTRPDGTQVQVGGNLVTDAGDEFIANRQIADTVDIVSGMKLGTGTTTAAKNGAGAAMVTYLSGSEKALDAAATASTLGAGAGWRSTYIVTWAAGEATSATLNEVCLTNQTPLTDSTSAEADTVARFVFTSTIDKQAADTLAVTWNIDTLGA